MNSIPGAASVLRWMKSHPFRWRALIMAFCHLLGLLTSIDAILSVRTAQGAIGWAISLNTFPYIAVPAYWVFGRSNFEGYLVLRRKMEADLNDEEKKLAADLLAMRPQAERVPPSATLLERLAKLPATRGNHTELLIDGEATFRSIFESIAQAREYVLVQFYIIRDDGLGRQLKEALINRARAGVRCYLVYDEIGSHQLPTSYTAELLAAGVEVRPFNTRQGDRNRFQLNFRNHRKIVIVDGVTAFVGGHNVGDEYLGKDPKMGAWRDTHVKVQGPVVQCVQIAWAEDWNWAAGGLPTLNWVPQPAPGGQDGLAFCLPPGRQMSSRLARYSSCAPSRRRRSGCGSPARTSSRMSSSPPPSRLQPCAVWTYRSSSPSMPTASWCTSPASPTCRSGEGRGEGVALHRRVPA
ncbi:phospholipase D-like domain-containing protein [Verrucomicrobium spinosum]|uniref:phospholipase D-like domain-containing protein n=1 Tax=Verrucomicrobium spinosum TaxID=2736 RepID=UPI001C446EDC|nr:phospholipase D-like domain-containing protein [Verrucomicrobium spinosum]